LKNRLNPFKSIKTVIIHNSLWVAYSTAAWCYCITLALIVERWRSCDVLWRHVCDVTWSRPPACYLTLRSVSWVVGGSGGAFSPL